MCCCVPKVAVGAVGVVGSVGLLNTEYETPVFGNNDSVESIFYIVVKTLFLLPLNNSFELKDTQRNQWLEKYIKNIQ